MEETQTKGKMGLNSQGLCLALNSFRLQFPGNKGMQDLRRHHSDPEEQMVPAAFSSSGSAQLIVSHLLSPPAAFSSPASAPSVCYGFPWSSFPRHPLGVSLFLAGPSRVGELPAVCSSSVADKRNCPCLLPCLLPH